MDYVLLPLTISSLISGYAGAWIVARYGARLGLMDSPSNRSSHENPTPKGGGFGILIAFMISSWTLGMPATFRVPITLISLFSLVGDRFDISPRLRLPIQFMAAIVILAGPFQMDRKFLLSILYLLLTAIFIVGTANFYNFMDGINGIAGMTGFIAFGLLALFGHWTGADPSLKVLAICISLACLGFLPLNIPRAKVFMGDVGSILLGFVFAGMAVFISNDLLDFACLIAFLSPFYADEFTTMLMRHRARENLLRPHRRHLYQLLANQGGLPHWKVSGIYVLLQLVVGISALSVRPFGLFPVLILLGVYLLGFVLLSHHMRARLEHPGLRPK